MGKNSLKHGSFEKDNAEALASLIVAPETSDNLRVQILNKLLDSTSADNFFDTMLKEDLSYGACPNCGHKNHWLVPEEDKNRMGWISHQEDSRVKRMTTAQDCKRFQEACGKKLVNV